MTQSVATLSARETARRVNAGTLLPADVVEAFADIIAARDGEVQAWTWFDRARALAEAERVDTSAPLAGVTVGVKDVIDTADMPTTYGSAVYDARPLWDAPCVVGARAAGAVMLGKTVSTEFAMSSPGKTRNPHNIAHTPGGSSSGSAAAVAAGMVHTAFGTQTSGSILRPASFCGVVGLKPSFGLLNRTAIKVLSDSLDTLGLLARDVRDAAFVAATLAEKPALAVPAKITAPRVNLFRTSRWELTEPATREALVRAEAALRDAGAVVGETPLGDDFEPLFAIHDSVMGWETPRSLAHEYRVLGERISPVTRIFLDNLSRTTRDDYDAALRALGDRAARLDALIGDSDVLIVPAAIGEAPQGLGATGDPVFNKVWTLLHGPCIAVPAGRGPRGLPVGVQVVGRIGDDARVLAAAAFLEDALAAQEGVGAQKEQA